MAALAAHSVAGQAALFLEVDLVSEAGRPAAVAWQVGTLAEPLAWGGRLAAAAWLGLVGASASELSPPLQGQDGASYY